MRPRPRASETSFMGCAAQTTATLSRVAPHLATWLAVAALLAFVPRPAAAETDYPVRPVQIVVPFVAGGNTDLITRIIADGLALALKQPFTVVTKPGAAANIGAAYV